MKNLEELLFLNREPLFPITDVRGMTGEYIRLILNELVAKSEVYLEAGLYCGLSFTSAMYKNNHISRAIAIDSWAEFTNHGRINPRKEFLEAVKKYYPNEVPLSLIESDHWQVTSLPAKPDLYYYDGDHSEQSQERALTHFGKMCADEFIYCCDDWNWEKVRKGTRKGLEQFEVVNEWEKILTPERGRTDTTDKYWWNGFYVALLRQK